MKPFILSFLFLLVYFHIQAQKISGFYTGTLYNDTTKLVQQYQLALSEYRGKITGYSYVTFVVNDTFYYGIRKVTARIDGDNLIVADDKFIANNFPESPSKGVKRLFVIPLNNQDSVVSLSGTWQTNRTKQFYPIPGTIELSKSDASEGSALFTHLKELDIIEPGNNNQNSKPGKAATAQKPNSVPANKEENKKPVVAIPFDQRAKKIISTVEIDGDSLQLSFYDNGVIDGDSISVYVNGVEVIKNVRLTATAIREKIAIMAGKEIEIILVAENLGTIPPNTGLVLISDGNKTHQLHFSADLQTNAAIILKRKNR